MTDLGIFISRTVLAEAKTNTASTPTSVCQAARLPGWALYPTPMLIFAIYTAVIGGINMRLHRLVVAKWRGFHVEMKDHCFLFLFYVKNRLGGSEGAKQVDSFGLQSLIHLCLPLMGFHGVITCAVFWQADTRNHPFSLPHVHTHTHAVNQGKN